MKKLLSIILALTMVIALIPAVFAADTDTKPLVYNFKWDAYKEATAAFSPRETLSGVNYAKYAFDDIDTEVSAQWRFEGIANIYNSGGKIDSEGITHQIYPNYDFSVHPNTYSIALNVTETGTMKTEISFKKKAYGYTADVYLVKEQGEVDTIDKTVSTLDEVKALVKNIAENPYAQYLGRINMDLDGTVNENKITTVTLGNATVTKGEYLLIWNAVEGEASPINTRAEGEVCSFTLTPVPEDEELTNAFTAKEETHTPATKNVYGYKSTDTANAIVNYEAVTTDTVTVSTTDTENFLYWAQGLTDEKKILSFEPSFEYTPSEGNNYLVAVYRDTSPKAEFFNANGQREAVLLADGTAPQLPERVGYKPAAAWVDLDGNTVAPGDTVTVSGYNSYVPNYGERISVTVNGTSYNYGDTVTLSCTASPYYQEGKYFKGWKKDNVIVSTSESYSFLAYKDTTVTAEWADAPFNFSGNGRKIVLDLFNNALMAEFIGFGDNVVEKGIMFTDTTKTRNIAMTTDSSQFVIIPDETGTYKGYAIVKEEDNSYTLITDGEYIK